MTKNPDNDTTGSAAPHLAGGVHFQLWGSFQQPAFTYNHPVTSRYGTCNELRITLQRSGFSREASSYIRQNASEYIIWENDEPKVKLSILECKNAIVKPEAEEIRYNVPELFVDYLMRKIKLPCTFL